MDEKHARRGARSEQDWGPFLEWAVLGRALGHGLRKGAIFGAVAGLPFGGIGAIPGSLVGAVVGLACAVLPAILLAAEPEKWRHELALAKSLAALLAASPWLAAALLSSSQPGVRVAVAGCGLLAATTVALLTRRILNGPPVRPGVLVGHGEPYRQRAA